MKFFNWEIKKQDAGQVSLSTREYDQLINDANIRPQLDPMTEGTSGDNIRLRSTGLSPHQMFYLANTSDTLRTIIFSLQTEVFKNGYEIKEKFAMKCMTCQKEFENATDQCDDCGSLQLRSPDSAQRELLEKLIKKVNDNGQSLKTMSKILEKDVDVVDDMFIVAIRNYAITPEGTIHGWFVKEFIRADPRWFEIIADNTGRLGYSNDGKQVKVCPYHRKTFHTSTDDERCQTCNTVLYPAHYRGYDVNGDFVYYLEGEVRHDSKYDHGLTYGTSPIISAYTKVVTLINQDTYMMKYYGKQRPPRGMLAINTSNVDSVQKAWGWLLNEQQKNPHQINPLIVERGQGDGQGGKFIEFIDFMRSLDEMQFTESREEFRRTIGAVWKVMPIFQADTAGAGGLNNEGLQITVTNRAVQDGQEIFNNNVHPWMLDNMGITDYELLLAPNEKQDELKDLEIMNKRTMIAQRMQQMGFTILLNEDMEFEYLPIDEPVLGPSQQPMMPGLPGMPIGMDPNMPPPPDDGFGGDPSAAQDGAPQDPTGQEAFKGGKKEDDYDQAELNDGTKEEMEHTKDPEVARRIAMDHLDEDPKYYKKLRAAGLTGKGRDPKGAARKTK